MIYPLEMVIFHSYVSLPEGTYPSEKYEFVTWDDEIPNWMESHKIHVPNHQLDISPLTINPI